MDFNLNWAFFPYLIAGICQLIIIGILVYFSIKKKQIRYYFSLSLVSIIFLLTSISFIANLNCYLGQKFLQKREIREGINYLEACLQIRSNFEVLDNIPKFFLLKRTDILNEIAFSYYNMEDYKAAASNYKKSLLIDANQFSATIFLAHSFFLEGNFKEAFEIYKKLSNFPQTDTYFYYYHNGLSRMHLSNYREAIENFEKALKKSPERNDINYLIAGCYSMLNNEGKAIAYLKKSIAYDKRYIELALDDPYFKAIRRQIEIIRSGE